MERYALTDKNLGLAIDRLVQRFRRIVIAGTVLLACLLIMLKSFDNLRSVCMFVLSERTIAIIRIVMQYLLGTQSVYVALQMLISYSFVFLGTISIALLALDAFRLLLLTYTPVSARLAERYVAQSSVYDRTEEGVYLVYSKLII